jgi:protein-S-isoprenylcysteine O-methyltransferase Ste14
MMNEEIAGAIWVFGVVAWFVIRLPHQIRARKTPVAKSAGGWYDRTLLVISSTGLGVIPGIYVVTGAPKFADYTFYPAQGFIGAALMAGALVLFWLTHKHLGRYWSVTLDTRKTHKLIDTGIYSRVRHPMYSAFWLLALAQCALLTNWFAGLAGPLAWATLFFLRVGREEDLMIDTFGDQYRRYSQRTKRVLPWVY